MIDDERMRAMDIQARLFQTAGKLIPVHPEHVLGLIARVEFAEAQCQAIAEAAIARGNANGIDIDAVRPELTDAEIVLQADHFYSHSSDLQIAYGRGARWARSRITALDGSEKAHG